MELSLNPIQNFPIKFFNVFIHLNMMIPIIFLSQYN